MAKSQRKFKIAFVADPLSGFDKKSETTFFLMHEANRRGWECLHIELKDLYLDNNLPTALCKQITVTKKSDVFSVSVEATKIVQLQNLDVIFLRKDPPVDLNFMDHLALLELVPRRVLVINTPSWIKLANEKLFTLHFEGLSPRTVVSQNTEILREFIRAEKTAIVKPLNLSGGRGVLKVSAADSSLSSLLDILTNNQTTYIMAQEYVPAATKGDKRILLLDGEILGAFLRKPGKSDFRGNLHSGAKLLRATITKRDREICENIKDKLKKFGLYFVGIDILGDYVTEINSTSPMGIAEINKLDKTQIEKTVLDWIEHKIRS